MARLVVGSSVAVGVVGASVGLDFSVLFRGLLNKCGRSDSVQVSEKNLMLPCDEQFGHFDGLILGTASRR